MTTKPSSQPSSPTKSAPGKPMTDSKSSPKHTPAMIDGAKAAKAMSADGNHSPRSPPRSPVKQQAREHSPARQSGQQQSHALPSDQSSAAQPGVMSMAAAYAPYGYAVYQYPAGAAPAVAAPGTSVNPAAAGVNAGYSYYNAAGPAQSVAGTGMMHNGVGGSPQLGGHSPHHQQQYHMGGVGGSPRHSGHAGRNRTNVDAAGRKTTVWMGLDAWMDEQAIKSIWASVLPGEEVQVKLITNKLTGTPANYCFLDFASHESAVAAVACDGTAVPGSDASAFRLNWATGGGHPESTNQPGASPRHYHSNEYSVFVGDLSMDVTDEMLAHVFSERFPSTKTAKVITDAASGISRGFGFVRFALPEDMQRAITEMNGVVVGQRGIRVGPAAPKPRTGQMMVGGYPAAAAAAGAVPQGASGAHGAFAYDNGSTRMYPGSNVAGAGGQNPSSGAPGGYRGAQSNAAANAALAAAAASDPSNTTVFVGGLSQPVSEDELRAVFATQGEVTNVKIPQAKACAFITYANRESAVQAISELNGFQVGQNRVRLSWGRPHAPRSHHQHHQHHAAGAAQQQYPQYAAYYQQQGFYSNGAPIMDGQQQQQQQQQQQSDHAHHQHQHHQHHQHQHHQQQQSQAYGSVPPSSA